MRKVVYYHDGAVADFGIPDDLYTAFAERGVTIRVGPGEDLEKAQRVLGRFVRRAIDEGTQPTMGHAEAVAACYIWHYFNTTDEETHIDGDILLVDMDGDESEITYMALSEAELVESA